MKVVFYADNTVPIAFAPLCDLLTRKGSGIEFAAGTQAFHVSTSAVRCPETYKSLPKALAAEAAKYDSAILCTAVPCENNYFFEADGSLAIVSFAGWHLLTRLPISNGIAYFTASIIADVEGIGSTHDENTGCLNDFWWDKSTIDVGMRAAFICATCAGHFTGDSTHLECVRQLLDLVSNASRLERDILALSVRTAEPNVFDVFLCHSSHDTVVLENWAL